MSQEVYLGEIDALLKGGALLVDVREQVEGAAPWASHAHIPLSRLTDLGALRAAHAKRPLVLYCRSGVMSYQAAQIAERLWTEAPVYYLAGGLLGGDKDGAGA